MASGVETFGPMMYTAAFILGQIVEDHVFWCVGAFLASFVMVALPRQGRVTRKVVVACVVAAVVYAVGVAVLQGAQGVAHGDIAVPVLLAEVLRVGVMIGLGVLGFIWLLMYLLDLLRHGVKRALGERSRPARS